MKRTFNLLIIITIGSIIASCSPTKNYTSKNNSEI